MSILRGEQRQHIHQGAIYQYRPFYWMQLPIWIARNTRFEPGNRYTQLFCESELSDAFRLGNREEEILVKAKKRFVIVISNEKENNESRYKEVLVVPFYSFIGKDDLENRRLTFQRNPSLFYIEPDPAFPQLVEGGLSLRNITLYPKDLLSFTDKLSVSLTETGINAILKRYCDYVSYKIPLI